MAHWLKRYESGPKQARTGRIRRPQNPFLPREKSIRRRIARSGFIMRPRREVVAMTVLNPTFSFRRAMGQLHGHDTMVHDLGAGVIAGQIAGLVMALLVMLVFGLIL